MNEGRWYRLGKDYDDEWGAKVPLNQNPREGEEVELASDDGRVTVRTLEELVRVTAGEHAIFTLVEEGQYV